MLNIRNKQLTSFLSLIFFFSGFASLIYQVVWQRILTLHYGVGAISITIIVTIYMLGLGIGALFGGIVVERTKSRISLYFLVELLIGLFGLISLPILSFLGRYTAGTNYFHSSFYVFSFLFIPTLLMGTTLPILTKLFNNLIHDFMATVSLLYFINTIGAALGSLFASYFLISFFGLDSALYFAVTINFILAFLIPFSKYFPSSSHAAGYIPSSQDSSHAMHSKIVYFLVFITGFLAIGYEIIWFRVIGVLVKASPYAFSTVLSVYLFGIALGSLSMNRWLPKNQHIDRISLFFLLQFFIAISVIIIFILYYVLTKYTALAVLTRHSFIHDLHPQLTIPSFRSFGTIWRGLFSLSDVFFWPLYFVFLPTCLMGASFPLISSLALSQPNKEGLTVGRVYFFNIIGNVFGGLLTGFIILPHFGTCATLIIFSLIGVFLGLFVTTFAGKTLLLMHKLPIAFIILIATSLFFPRNSQLYGIMHTSPGTNFIAYIEEGIDAVILTYYHPQNIRNYINGLHHGGRPGYEYYTKVIEAVSFAPKIDKALIIGYGTGSFTEAILKFDELGKVTVVEISNALITNLKKLPRFPHMLGDKRLQLVIDDARRFLLRTDERYDLILMDPLRTTTSYSNNLYSKEFLSLLKKHLTNEGILLLFTDELRVLPKTVLSVFDQIRLYRHRTNFFMISSNLSLVPNPEKKMDLLQHFSPSERKGISRYNPQFLGDQNYIKDVARQYSINRDLKPICEYYIGLRVKERFFKNYN